MKNLSVSLFILLPALLFISCNRGGGHAPEQGYQYHTPQEVETFLDEVKLNYPSITSLETVGYSTEGKVIRAIVISDNPGIIEGEPAIRLTGGVHGSEKISVELMIRFIEYLTYNYSKSSSVKGLVDSRYIVVIPVLNPDGLAAGTRYNSRGVDLNRNFSYAWAAGTARGDYAFSESETRAVRDFSAENIFHLSATFHSGAVLLNMPFDYGRELDGVAPVENELVQAYGKSYTTAGTFLDNPDLSTYSLMDEGVINGGNWYVITGSMQDWSYKETGCLDMTIEVAHSSPATEAEVEQIFLYNRDSLMAYITKAGYGVHGRVTSAAEPGGVKDVEITVVYDSGSGVTGDLTVKTDSKGYYHRILEAGEYNLVFSKTGYLDYTVSGVSVQTETSLIEQNIVLTTTP